VRYPPPLLGQHDDEILGSLGYKSDDISRLRSASVIR
jgi:crotonobetainyl-CoA:carnitine CoA-transferase CaiB-like acyl-CoA transferase